MAKTVEDINLLPNKGANLLTIFLTWTLNIGRLLIILTETLALGTFLYRFSLDMRIVDLHDQIKNESFIVKNFTSEPIFRNLQDRLTLAKTYDSSSTTAKVFQDIVNMGRDKLTFRNLLISGDNIKIDAQSPSASALSSFVNMLKNYPLVKTVSLNKVENKTASALVVVEITATLQSPEQLNQTVPIQPVNGENQP